MARIGRNIRRYARDAVVALRVAPIEVALGIGVAVLWSMAMEAGDDAFLSWLEMAALSALAGGIAWSATLLRGMDAVSDRGRWLIAVAGLAAVVLYDVTLLDFDRSAEVWRAAALLAALVPAIALMPLLATAPGDHPDRRFREVNLRMATRLVGVTLYAGALYLGLVLAIAAVNNLFELDLDGEIYGHVFGAIAFGLAPWIFVGGAPAITAPPAPPSDAGRIIRRFAAYLLLPLLLVYDGILYAYVVRIAVVRELPANLVSPLALLAALIAAAAVMLFIGGPAQHDEGAAAGVVPGNAPGEAGSALQQDAGTAAPTARANAPAPPSLPWPARLAAPVFLPLGALGVWAIAIRVGQYGWTEFRYARMAALGALLLLAGLATVALIRRRAFRAYPVALTLAIAAFLSAIGPWGVVATSRRSQQARLEASLQAAGIVTAGFPVMPTGSATVSRDIYTEINAGGRYLAAHHGEEAVERVAAVEGHPGRNLAGQLGLVAAPETGATRWVNASLDAGIPTERLGAGTVYAIHVPAPRATDDRPITARILGSGLEVEVRTPAGRLLADLGPLARALMAQADSAAVPGETPPGAESRPVRMDQPRLLTLTPDEATLTLRGEDGAAAGRIFIRQISIQRLTEEEEGGDEAGAKGAETTAAAEAAAAATPETGAARDPAGQAAKAGDAAAEDAETRAAEAAETRAAAAGNASTPRPERPIRVTSMEVLIVLP